MRQSWIGVFLACMLVGSVAFAQERGDASEEPPESEPPAPPTAEEVESGRDGDGDAPELLEGSAAGWDLLEQAMSAMARGDRDAARHFFEKLRDGYPNHPAVDLSDEAFAALQGAPSAAFARRTDDGDTTRSGGEATSGIARAELAILQTIHGIGLGTEVCILLECEDPRMWTGSLASGAGLGLGLSLYLTRNGITPGHTLALNSGAFWGAANGLLVDISLERDLDRPKRPIVLMASGQLLGMTASELVYRQFRPTGGDMGLTNTTAFWSGFGMLLLNGMIQPEEPRVTALSTLFAIDAGIVGGAVLSKYFPMTRGRAFVLDAGGIVGSLAGVGTYLLVTGSEGEPVGGFGSTLVGAGVGLGLTAYLTRNWDVAEGSASTAHWMVAPTRHGGAQLVFGGSL